MRTMLMAGLLLVASAALAKDSDTFEGWSKDGSWFVHQTVSGPNDLTELFFCSTDKEVQPSWPDDLNELERQDGRISCVRYTDPNRAPYGWKALLVPPKPSPTGPGGARVHAEYTFDTDRPGYVVEVGAKKTTCYVSGLREDSKLGAIYWHSNGRWVGAFVDGSFVHCDVALKSGPPPVREKPAPGGKKKKGKSS